MSSIESLPRRARGAYERGRTLAAAREIAWLVPFIALALDRCASLSLGCVASLALVSLLLYFRWKGGVWGRAALVGACVGLPALVLPVLVRAGAPLAPALFPAACAIVCPTVGLFAGSMLGSWGERQGPDRRQALLAGGLVVGVCGALGCGVLGVAAMIGMWVTATVATLAATRLARL